MSRVKSYILMAVLAVSVGLGILSANSLSKEESPYLQQHSNNPVNWFAWGDSAFKKAKSENKLIFLSIGYSTCHWCHVMERESFEDKEIADILNKNFISIKVDREEHPQIDRYYQLVYQILNGKGGGWPLTIIMTPDREPFFAGTYIPKEAKHPQGGLKDILNVIVKSWIDKADDICTTAHKIKLYADEMRYRSSKLTPKKPDENISKLFVDGLSNYFDKKYGGWGDNIKFPQASRLLTLIDIYLIGKSSKALDMVEKTLDSMALSGIYDQIEGGFFRYSTDKEWRVPHFEKMLYTNAELIEVYSKAWKVTKKPLYKMVVQDTIEMFLTKYRDKSGLFYGASDADSLNPKTKIDEEGYYFTYSYDEVKDFLKSKSVNEDIIKRGLKHYGITEGGNFINFRNNTYIADQRGSFLILKDALKEIREMREYPFIDKKMLSSWNALMIHSLFTASKIDNSYGMVAKSTLDVLLNKLYINKILYHQILPDREPKVKGSLEDYIFVVEALLDAYDYTMDENYISLAEELQQRAKELFFDDSRKLWVDSRGELSNPLNLEDGSYKSTLATLIFNYLRLATLKESIEYNVMAKDTLYHFFEDIQRYSTGSATSVRATLAYMYGYVVIKSPKGTISKLKSSISSDILYPFIEYKIGEDAHFQACKIEKCFIYEKNVRDFLQKLKRVLASHPL